MVDVRMIGTNERGSTWVKLAISAVLLAVGCGGELGRSDADLDELADADVDAWSDAGGDGDADADADADGDADGDSDGDGDADADAAGDADVESDADAPAAGPLRLYVAPGGDDSRDGSSEAEAVLTLRRVQELLVTLEPTMDIEVRIAPGRYFGQTVEWTWTRPTQTIRFMPLHDDRDRPIFDGCLDDSSSRECPGGTWFTLRHSAGEETNLHFEYIRVEHYGTAISFNGGRNDEADSNGSNRIYGCYFQSIGNVFNEALDPATAAVRLVNSDDNEIANNHFVDVINTRSAGLIHCLYIAHMSDRNVIDRNRFQRSSGDPIRLRDFSNDNEIEENRLIQVGENAGYTDWYCDHDARDDCTKPTAECPSWGNLFRYNSLDGTWDCRPLSTWHLFQGDETTGCSSPAPDARRVRTAGNEQTEAPCSS